MANITKENYIVVYRLGDSESKEFAEYYANKHDLSISDIGVDLGGSGLWEVYGQLVGIPCSEVEILDSEGDFNTEVVLPLQDAILNSFVFADRDIWGVVLGYNIPGGFYDPGISALFSSDNPSGRLDADEIDIISSTSRLSRALSMTGSQSFHNFDKKVFNKLYNRSVFQRFNEEDAEHAVVVSRIDAPTLALAKSFADNADRINRQGKARGKFYIDPYSDRAGPTADAYTDTLVDFRDNFLPKLGIEVFTTTFLDPYIDVTTPFVQNDSFVWQWFADRATSDFFKETPSIRVFFFSADNDSSLTVRESTIDSWSFLALQGKYSAVSGAMSKPGNETYLNPTPFFDALIRGATIGEAYLFSLPNLDWTFTLFGDPLSTVVFPGVLELKEEDETILDEDVSWTLVSQDLARIAAHLYAKENEISEIRDEIVDTNIEGIEVNLLYKADRLYQLLNNDIKESEIRSFINNLFDYPSKRFKYNGLTDNFPTINDYLTQKGIKISQLLINAADNVSVGSDNIYDEGYWEFEFEINDDAEVFVNYHFILDVSSDNNFGSNIIMTRDSSDLLNWSFEINKGNFTSMLFSGVPTSKVGRKVKYQRRKDTFVSVNESLERGVIYYFRVTQYNAITGQQFMSRTFSDIIYT